MLLHGAETWLLTKRPLDRFHATNELLAVVRNSLGVLKCRNLLLIKSPGGNFSGMGTYVEGAEKGRWPELIYLIETRNTSVSPKVC